MNHVIWAISPSLVTIILLTVATTIMFYYRYKQMYTSGAVLLALGKFVVSLIFIVALVGAVFYSHVEHTARLPIILIVLATWGILIYQVTTSTMDHMLILLWAGQIMAVLLTMLIPGAIVWERFDYLQYKNLVDFRDSWIFMILFYVVSTIFILKPTKYVEA